MRIYNDPALPRISEPVRTGIPLPLEAQIFMTADLCLVDGATGETLPADLIPTARWGGAPEDDSKPIRWLLASFPATVPAQATGLVYLVDAAAPAPATRIAVGHEAGLWTIDTGPARFELQENGFDLFHRVTIGDADIVRPSDLPSGPYFELVGTTWQARSAAGGCQISVFRQGANDQTLTLKIKGSHRSFAPGDETATADEDLDFNTFMTFHAGSARVTVQHTVQNNRPWVPLENNADFRTIGSPHSVSADEIGLALALQPGAAETWVLATSADSAGAWTGALSQAVSVYQDSSGDDNWNLWQQARATGSNEVDVPVYAPAAYVQWRGYQVRTGGTVAAQGDKMAGFLCVGGPQGGVTVAVEDFWQNFPKALRAASPGVVDIALFPREFRARHVLRVGEQKTHTIHFLFHGPGAQPDLVAAASLARPLIALADPAWFAHQCRVLPAVAMSASNVWRFDSFLPAAPDNCGMLVEVSPAEHDRYLRRHLYGPGASGFCNTNAGANDYAFNGIADAVSNAQLYGWMDFGDLPVDFEQQEPCSTAPKSVTGQYGWKYNGDFGLWLQALRAWEYDPDEDGRHARLDFFRQALAATRHAGDIDVLHHGRQSGRGIHDFRDGGAFGHSQHHDDGLFNPHRNGATNNPCGGGNWNGTPTPDILFGLPAQVTAYWVTGDPVFAESAADLAEWTRFWIDAYGPAESNERAAANLLSALFIGWWPALERSRILSRVCVMPAEALLKSTVPLSSGPRCCIAAAIRARTSVVSGIPEQNPIPHIENLESRESLKPCVIAKLVGQRDMPLYKYC